MRTTRFVIVGALGLSLLGTSALASPGSPSPPTVSAPQQRKATPQELLIQAEGLVTKIAGQANDTYALRASARGTRDALKLGCIENQLTVSRALVEASEGNIASLRTSVRLGRDVSSLHTNLVVLAGESDATHQAAAACLGSKEVAAKRNATTPLPLPGAAGGGKAVSGKSGLNEGVPGIVQVGIVTGVRALPASP
jgi:hypothetical protein